MQTLRPNEITVYEILKKPCEFNAYHYHHTLSLNLTKR